MSVLATPLYQELATLISAVQRCRSSGRNQWAERHEESLSQLVNNYLPSGSGVDNGTKLDLEASGPEKLVFTMGYHHMNDNGYYTGWTHHTVVVRPSLQTGFTLRISGRDKNGIKDYLRDLYHHALSCQVWQTEDATWHSDLYASAPTP